MIKMFRIIEVKNLGDINSDMVGVWIAFGKTRRYESLRGTNWQIKDCMLSYWFIFHDKIYEEPVTTWSRGII